MPPFKFNNSNLDPRISPVKRSGGGGGFNVNDHTTWPAAASIDGNLNLADIETTYTTPQGSNASNNALQWYNFNCGGTRGILRYLPTGNTLGGLVQYPAVAGERVWHEGVPTFNDWDVRCGGLEVILSGAWTSANIGLAGAGNLYNLLSGGYQALPGNWASIASNDCREFGFGFNGNNPWTMTAEFWAFIEYRRTGSGIIQGWHTLHSFVQYAP